MASSFLEVGSKGLTELKNDLTNLSKALHELFELMNADMRQVGEAWRDGKYEEFVSGYRPQINKCEEISERYAEWCKRVLEPAIEECIEIETTDVGGDGGSSGGGGAAAAAVSDGASSGSSGSDKFGGFNMGGGKPSSTGKAEKFRKATEDIKAGKYNHLKPVPPDSGFETPQNERPHLTPAEWAQILDGRGR